MISFYDCYGEIQEGVVVRMRRYDILVRVKYLGEIWVSRDDLLDDYAA